MNPIEMIDVAFETGGGTLPASYPFGLWEELTRLLPLLLEHEGVGVIPLRVARSKEGMLLPKRAKLVLRLPVELATAVTALEGQQLNIAGNELLLGVSKKREIRHYSTLHAQLVTGTEDEISFMAGIEATLSAMEVKANLICGRFHTLAGDTRSISGYSLVIHDLSPEGSLRVQYAGLGNERQHGCGIFEPHKVISG